MDFRKIGMSLVLSVNEDTLFRGITLLFTKISGKIGNLVNFKNCILHVYSMQCILHTV